MNESGFYRSSFGNVQIFCSRISTNRGRTLVVHEGSGGDEHVVEDMGANVVVATADMLFDYMIGDALSPLDRLNEFKALVGTSQVFTHPVEGSFDARIGDFSHEVNADGTLSASISITATQRLIDVIPAGLASIPASGEGAVDAAADVLKAERAELELMDTGVPDAAKKSVSGWNASADLNPRTVIVDTGSYTSKLAGEADTLSGDIEKFEAFKRTVMLADAIQLAAKALTADSISTFVYRVGAPTALRTLIASEYGAEYADYYMQQVMRLNDLANPGLLDEGSILSLPAVPSSVRNG